MARHRMPSDKNNKRTRKGRKVNLEARGIPKKLYARMVQIIKKVFKGEKKSERGEWEVSVVGVSRERIKMLNKMYRKKNKATDVLSFNYQEEHDSRTSSHPLRKKAGAVQYGEIMLCLKEAEIRSRQQRMPRASYLVWLVVHASLHLLGNHHEDKESDARMAAREQRYLGEGGMPPSRNAYSMRMRA